MRHSISFRRPTALALAAIALSLFTASQASAQAGYDANKLAGKTFPEVNKILGKPVMSSSASASKDIIYATYKTPGTIITRVIFAIQTKRVKQIQILLPSHGEDPSAVLKRFKLGLGVNPKSNPAKKAPALSLIGSEQPPASPWQVVLIANGLAMTFQTELTDYLKAKKLPYGSTYFWTIQLTPRRGARTSNRVLGGG